MCDHQAAKTNGSTQLLLVPLTFRVDLALQVFDDAVGRRSVDSLYGSVSLGLLCLCRVLKVIAAEGEQKASRGLKEAANIMNRSKGAMQLRYLQTLTVVAGEKNHTIMFPLPLDLVNRVLGALGGNAPAAT